jgi:hypothetical protein
MPTGSYLKKSVFHYKTGLENMPFPADDQSVGAPYMSGLYQRALQIYRQTVGLRLVGKGEEGLDIEDVSPEDRAKILSQINEVIDSNRIRVEPDTFTITAKHSGTGLPILINGAIVAAVAATLLIFSFFFNRQEDVLATGAGTILSAESKVIETLRQESQEQLQLKDREILSFQQQLQDTLEQQRRLQAETDQTIRQREEQLEDEFQRTLEEERQRLLDQGLAAVAVEERLQTFEAEQRSELEAEFETFRRQTEEAAAQREEAIAGLVREYEQNLQSAQAERSELEQQLQERETELQKQYEEQAQALESDRARVAAQLNRLQEEQRQEQLVRDQILSAYETVNVNIAAKEYALALQQLESIRSYLDQEPARSLAGIQRRRPVERFIITSLQDLIRSRSAQEEQDLDSLIAAGSRINALNQGISRANQLLERGDTAAARQQYLSALGEIPSARQGYEGLAEIDERAEATIRQAAGTAISRGNTLYRNEQFQASLDRYREALTILLEDSAAAGRIVDQIAEISLRLSPVIAAAPEQPQPVAQPDEEQLRVLEQYQERIEALEDENARLANQLKGLQEREQRLQNENDRMTAALERFEAQESSLESENARLKEQLERLQAQQQLLQGDQTQVAGQVQRLQDEKEALSAQAQQLRDEKDKLAEQVKQLQAERDGLISIRDRIQAERDGLVAERNRLAQERKLAAEVEAQRDKLRERLDALETRFQTQRPSTDLRGDTSPETLANLLEAKLLTWQIIGSDPIAGQYPELYDTMENYLDTLTEQSVLEGRYSAVQDMITVVDALLSTPTAQVPADLWRRYSYTDRENLLSQLMGKLEVLLE